MAFYTRYQKMNTAFASLALATEPKLLAHRQLFLELTPPPKEVPQFKTQVEAAVYAFAANSGFTNDQVYDTVPGTHYADAWAWYIHPDCKLVRPFNDVYMPQQRCLTREVIDLGQALINEVCRVHNLPPVLLEEMIHAQETGATVAPGPRGYVSIPDAWVKSFAGSNLSAFLVWLQYWLSDQDQAGYVASPIEEIPTSQLDPLTWWCPTMIALYEEVCRRRSRSHDHKLALSRDLLQNGVAMEIDNSFGFSGLYQLVSDFSYKRKCNEYCRRVIRLC